MWADAAKLLSSRSAASSVIARKFATKLVQRIGLTFLPATVAAWRYQQNSVSINESLSRISSDKQDTGSVASQTQCSPVAHDDSARPALQPSALVDSASPATSPTAKTHRHASDRQTDTFAAGAEEVSTLHTNHQQQGMTEDNGTEVEYDEDIPEEIEEVCTACLTMCLRLHDAAGFMRT